jgi:hypothetical protein
MSFCTAGNIEVGMMPLISRVELRGVKLKRRVVTIRRKNEPIEELLRREKSWLRCDKFAFSSIISCAFQMFW